MYSPATRLLTVLELLQARPLMTAAQLAERLEVNARSARRYITMLQDMGIPIEAERGRHGGYRLRPGFKLPPLMLNEDEALAVTLGLLAARGLGLTSALPAVEGALSKIERVLPLVLRERVQALQQTVALDLLQPAVSPGLGWLVPFSTAAHQGCRLCMGYASRDREVMERLIDPYGVVYREGRWYAVGYCHLRREVRVFRLDRVVAARPLDQRFVRPGDFDSLSFVIGRFAAIPDRWLVKVLLQTTIERIRWLVPPAFATMEERAEGVLLQAYDRDLDHAARFLIGLGCPMQVQEPPELLQALRRQAEAIAWLVDMAGTGAGAL